MSKTLVESTVASGVRTRRHPPSHLGDESELVGLRLFRAFIDHESEGLTPPFLRWRAAPSGLEGDLLIGLGRSNGPRRLSDLIMQRGDQR